MDFWGVVVLLGGLGLFLYGMKLMSEALEAAAGDKLRNGLEALTKNRFAAVGLGAGVTAVIQSSSATTVMVVGFVNAGLMTLTQAINVGMGANIGTTVTAQIIALNITGFAPLVLFIGVLIMLFVKKRSVRRIGEIIGGLGILLFGMQIMSGAVAPLKEFQPFVDAISSFEQPWIGLFVGLGVTAIIQSSSATMGIVQAFAMQGLMGLDSAVFVILGLNIGTCVTAILASISGTKTAKRTAIALLFFNIIGAMIFMPIVMYTPLVDWIKSWSPGEPVRQLANFHTFFNLATTALFIGFPIILTKISYFFIRGEDKELEGRKLKYITPNLDSPTVVVGQAILEVERMAKIAGENFDLAIKSFIDKDEKIVDEVVNHEKTVNFLDHAITEELSRLSQSELSETDSRTVTALLHTIMDVERISDIAQNISDMSVIRIDRKTKISKEALAEIVMLSDKVSDSIYTLQDVIKTGNKTEAKKVMDIEDEVDMLEQKIKKNHVKRLKKAECTPSASTVFTDIITMCERVADHSANVAAMYYRGEL
ncbi:MAG: Na/Pi cotransporter family protein [Christensenellaceae bacterium]